MTTQQQHVTFPHLSPYAVLGEYPDKSHDIAPSAVFMVLFILGAAFHMTTFQLNNRKGHKFIISGVVFGFCMSRIVTTSLRIAWACHPHNVRLAIASQIFNNAGVVLLFVVSLIFAQRILRSIHPRFQWNKPVSLAFKIYIASLIAALIVVIVTTVMGFYTINPHVQKKIGDARKVCTIWFAVFAFSPIVVVIIALLLPKRDEVVPFGKRGNLKEQIAMTIFASFWLTFGAAWRAAIGFYQNPAAHPAWYQSRAAFYLIFFTIEIGVVYFFGLLRMDQRFHIPNKAERIAIRDGKSTESDLEKGAVKNDAETEMDRQQDSRDADNLD